MAKQNRVTAVGCHRIGYTPTVTFVRSSRETCKCTVHAYHASENRVKMLVDVLCTKPYTKTGHTQPETFGWVTTFR